MDAGELRQTILMSISLLKQETEKKIGDYKKS
jgi:hypothetical protein